MANCENLTPYEGTIPGTPGLSTVQEMAACNGYRGWFLTTFIPWLQNAYQNICLAVGLADGLIDTSKYTGEYSQGGTYDKGQSVSVGDIIYISKIDANTTPPPGENWARTSISWGSVTGNIEDQPDLSEALSLKIGSLSEDEAPQLSGALDCNGKTINGSGVRQIADANIFAGTHPFNYADGDMQQVTATGNAFGFSFSGFPSGQVSAFIIDAVNWGAYTVTHPTGMLFAGGEAPTYTAAGTDRLLVTCDKDGILMLTVIAQDIKAIA